MRHDFDPGKASAVIKTLPKGDYEVMVGDPKAFIRKKSGSEDDTYGIRFPLRVMGGTDDGSNVYFSTYLASEGGQNYAKQFMMAVMGFSADDKGEAAFNQWAVQYQWGYDVESGDVDDGYRQLKGQRVVASLDVTFGKDAQGNDDPERQYQQFTGFHKIVTS